MSSTTSDSGEQSRTQRPQSLLAASFAEQLNDIFLINDTLDQLSQAVESKRFSLTSQNVELSALEARLKRTEELLEQKKKRLSVGSPTGATSPTSPPPMPKSPPPPPPVAEDQEEQGTHGAGGAANGYVVVERSPSVVNGGGVVENGAIPPMPTRMAPPVPTE